jgi:hypothetical protein
MGANPGEDPASTLLVDESFAQQDDQFVERLRSVRSSQYLAAFADRWKQDPRPWAREQIFKYLAMPMDRPGHHPVVKRLFKHAEAKRDDELMAAFLVAFDRLIRRERRTRYRWDFQTRQSWREEELFAPRNQILPTKQQKRGRDPWTGESILYQPKSPKNGRLFSYATRQYLRRRAWRYFRWMGFGRPNDYPRAISRALISYRDDDFAEGENILDNWSLMNAAFRNSEVLTFSPSKVTVTEGWSLGQMAAAPRFEDLWKKPESADVLLDTLLKAQSRLVRVWAIQLLKRHHTAAMQQLTSDQLLQLIDHEDDEVQQFGASLLDSTAAIDAWQIETWLRLLETRNLTALANICDVMNERVRPDRLTLEQCVALACARITPVARLGLNWLRARSIDPVRDAPTLVGLAQAQCEAAGAEIATFALSIVGTPQTYRADTVVNFFDSLNPEVRRGAWEWLTPQSPGFSDPDLWSRLFESPYDDVRLRLVDELRKRTEETHQPPAIRDRDFAPLWASVLLNVHRGGRAKRHALRQISQTIAAQPEKAEHLMPVLTVAIRSVRPAEARIGLSAILSAVAVRPELEIVLAKAIPELHLAPSEVAK